MKKILFLLSFLALGMGASAQEPAPADAAKLALAREAIAAMQVDNMLNGMAGQIKQMAMQRAQLPATATPAQRARFDTFMGRVSELALTEVKTIVAKLDGIYAEVYSEAELTAITAFFSTAEGKSMLAKQPQVMTRLMPMMQQLQQAMLPKLQQLAQEFDAEMKAEQAAAAATAPAPAVTLPSTDPKP